MRKLNFSGNKQGVAAIEFAIILPILILIILVVIESGIYFLKSQTAARAVSSASLAIQQNPSDATIKLSMEQNGLGLMDLSNLPNYVCAKAYNTLDRAKSASCNAGVWDTNRPSDATDGQAYFVAVKAFAEHSPLTPIKAFGVKFLPDIAEKHIIQISNSSKKTGWVNFPNGTVADATLRTSISPEEWCLRHDYKFATGACKFDATAAGYFLGHGVLVTNKQGGSWNWSCLWGSDVHNKAADLSFTPKLLCTN